MENELIKNINELIYDQTLDLDNVKTYNNRIIGCVIFDNIMKIKRNTRSKIVVDTYTSNIVISESVPFFEDMARNVNICIVHDTYDDNEIITKCVNSQSKRRSSSHLKSALKRNLFKSYLDQVDELKSVYELIS